VTQRATDHELLFVDSFDRRGFLHILLKTAKRWSWEIHDYCLLSNHFHLVVRTLEPSIAEGMQHLNARHVAAFNAAHSRRGTLVQGRYYAGLIESEAQYLTTRAYVALNPVEAGLCASPDRWPWSGYGGGGAVSPAPDERFRRFVAAYRNRHDLVAEMAVRDTAGL
jgi:putative transposase